MEDTGQHSTLFFPPSASATLALTKPHSGNLETQILEVNENLTLKLFVHKAIIHVYQFSADCYLP